MPRFGLVYLRDWNWDWQRQQDLLAALEKKKGQCSLLQHLLLACLSFLRNEGGHDNGNDDEDRKHLNESHFCFVVVVVDWFGATKLALRSLLFDVISENLSEVTLRITLHK